MTGGDPHPYVLGHSAPELERLARQAHLVEPITREIFVEAGVAPGMRVLDIGSGAGDVAFLAADLVGSGGVVVGVDLSATALAEATRRAKEKGLANVTFREGDPTTMTFDRPFDAVVGRYVLQFQKDPAAMLRALARHICAGGVIVFHELSWTGIHASPPVPLYNRCRTWGEQTLQRHGTEPYMGMKLHAAYADAGLPTPSLRYRSLAAAAVNAHELIRLVTEVIKTLLPEMERLGVADAREVEIETLADRIFDDAVARNALLLGYAQVGAWSRVATR